MDIEVSLDPKQLEEVRSRLAGLPKQARFALTASIRYALRRARTQSLRIAGERYNIGDQYSKAYRWALRSMGPVRTIGTTGFVHVSGARIPLQLLPHMYGFGFGVQVRELKGEPMLMRHDFGNRWNKVWHRMGKGSPRYPILPEVGLSTSEMVGQRSDVAPKLEKSIATDLHDELYRLMNVALSGGFATPKR